jgi:hypothetical protein
MAHKFIQPGKQQVGFVAQLAGQNTGVGLECFQLATQGISLGPWHHADRCIISLFLILAKRSLGEHLHRFLHSV